MRALAQCRASSAEAWLRWPCGSCFSRFTIVSWELTSECQARPGQCWLQWSLGLSTSCCFCLGVEISINHRFAIRNSKFFNTFFDHRANEERDFLQALFGVNAPVHSECLRNDEVRLISSLWCASAGQTALIIRQLRIPTIPIRIWRKTFRAFRLLQTIGES